MENQVSGYLRYLYEVKSAVKIAEGYFQNVNFFSDNIAINIRFCKE